MIVMITGGSGSGKSEYAESKAVLLHGSEPLLYLATMKGEGQEAEERIKRHRALRSGKGFSTLECQRDLKQVLEKIGEKRPTILLECMSNLTANEMFEGEFTQEQWEDACFWRARGELLTGKLKADLDRLAEKCSNLVVVTNDVFADGCRYDPASGSYLQLLGRVNRYLADRSDEVTEVVFSCPVILKPEK